MSVLTPNQEIFAQQVSKLTGLDHNVVRGWVLAEESGSAARGRDAAGNQNWLNYSAGSGPGGRFDHPEWNSDPLKAATATAHVINTSSNYTGIKATAGAHPSDQIEAIATSPWSSDHYGGGSHLVSTYHLVSGLPAPKIISTSPSPSTAPKIPETAAQTPQSKPAVSAADSYIPTAHLHGGSIPLPAVAGSSPFGHLKGATIPLPPFTEPAKPKAKTSPKASKPSPFKAPDPVTNAPAPSGKTAIFEGTTVAAWMIPALVYGRAHGWTGKVTSGVRSTAEQAVLYQRYKAGGNIAAKPGQSNHELQNGGAFDATNGSQLWKILQGYKGKRPIWAPSVGLNDSVHFSSTGR